MVTIPLGKYEDFKACRKEHSAAYCGELYWRIHGKKKGAEMLKHEIQKLKEILNAK